MAADLSVSMAGYNTCMNIIQAGVPALVYPFAQNREQTFRAQRLARKADIGLVTKGDLTPLNLANHMEAMLGHNRYRTGINVITSYSIHYTKLYDDGNPLLRFALDEDRGGDISALVAALGELVDADGHAVRHFVP